MAPLYCRIFNVCLNHFVDTRRYIFNVSLGYKILVLKTRTNMKLLLSFSLLTLASAYMQELTDTDFYAYAKDKEVLLVDFYAPW